MRENSGERNHKRDQKYELYGIERNLRDTSNYRVGVGQERNLSRGITSN